MKRKVHIISKYFYPVTAGIENNIEKTYSVLAEKEWDVTVHTSRDTYGKKDVLSDRDFIKNLDVKRYKYNKFGFFPKIDFKKADFICLHNFDIFPHLIILIYSFFLKILGRKRFTIILTPHGGFTPEWRVFPKNQAFFKYIYQVTLGTFLINFVVDGIRAVSPWEKKEMIKKGIDPKKVKLISNGLEDEAYLDVDHLAGKTVKSKVRRLGDYIIQIGRVCPIKNQETAIRALSKIPGNLKFIIVGPSQGDEYKKKLVSLSKDLNLSKRVNFLGVVRGIDKYYLIKHAKVMVHMAIWEANCNVIHEAWSQHLICVTGNEAGLSVQIKNNINGYKLPVFDDEAVSQKIKFVLKNYNSPKLNKIRENNMNYVKNHSWRKVAERMERYYEEVKTH